MYNMNQLLISLSYYLFLFILPVFLYIKFKDKLNPISYLKLDNKPLRGIAIGLCLSLIFLLFLIIKNNLYGWKPLNYDIGLLWISVLLIGILEEVPFRGFILQKLMGKTNFLTANIITTLLFIFMHYPIWILTGADIFKSTISGALISLIFGYLFVEYDSLWIPIICHSAFNMSIWINLK